MTKPLPYLIFGMGLLLSACATAPVEQTREKPATVESAPLQTKALGVVGQTVASLDRTSEAEKQAALAAPVTKSKQLGTAAAALGSPSDQGLWVQTPLVNSATPGRVTLANGKSLAVELRPTSGATLMSLAAYQALGVGLTDLPQVNIFAQ